MSGPIVIRSVKLTNILSHTQTYIEFPLGLTALVGPNGAGKSSIVDSIVYALFTHPQNIKSLRGGSKKSFLRLGTSTGSIEVELSIGGRKYVVYRVISATKSDEVFLYEVLEDGKRKLIASSIQQVLDSIKKLMSIPSADSVRYTIISRQNEIAELLNATPAVRKELILKLLGLEGLEQSKELLGQYLRDIEGKKIRFNEYRGRLEEIRKKINDVTTVIEKDKEELKRLEEEIRVLMEKVGLYEKLLELLREYETLSKAIEIVNELKNIEQALPVCKEVLGISIDEYVTVMTMIKERKKDLEEAGRKLNELESRYRSWIQSVVKEVGIDVAEKDLQDISKVLEVLENFGREVEQKISLKQAEISMLRSSTSIVEISTKCPLCGRELDEDAKNRVLLDIKRRSDEIARDLKNLENIYTVVRKAIDEAKRFERSRLEILTRIDSDKKHLENYLRKFRELKDKVDKIVEKAEDLPIFSPCKGFRYGLEFLKCLNKLSIEYTKLYEEKKSVLKKILGKEVGIEEVISRFNKVKEEMKSMGFDVENINVKSIEDEYRKFKLRVDEVREKLGKVRGRLESNAKLLDELIKEEKEVETMLTNISRDIQVYPILNTIVNTLLGKDGVLAKVLTLEARRLMEKYTNNILKELGMDFKVKISEDFDIDVYSGLGVLDIKSLSGGETVALAIALRIALAYTIFGRLPGFFILDEPTQFLDVERRRAVFEIIKRLSEKVPQVIVVTHDQEVEELSDKVYFVSKEGGRSVVREKEKFVEVIARE